MINRIEIPLSSKKIISLPVTAVSIILLGLWLVFYTPAINTLLLGNPIVIKTVGWLCILLFGLFFFLIGPKFFDNRLGLVIDENGIIDNSSIFKLRRIAWDDISSTSGITIYHQQLILIHVRNPQYYIKLEKNILKKVILSSNYNIYGTPISISHIGLTISFDELYQLLRDRLELSRRQS